MDVFCFRKNHTMNDPIFGTSVYGFRFTIFVLYLLFPLRFSIPGLKLRSFKYVEVGCKGHLNSDSKRKAQNYIQNFVNKNFRKQFYFLTSILPDYAFHKSLKEFWQNSYFENMRAGSLKGVNFHLGKLALK